MAVFTAVQPLADAFCFWLPLYYEAKLVLAVYLWANGARRGKCGRGGESGGAARGRPCGTHWAGWHSHTVLAG